MHNSFDSIDKMMELGMSLAVAQQMMATMNRAFNDTQIPTVGIQPPQMPTNVDNKEFFFVINGGQAGPFKESELSDLISRGLLKPDTLGWMSGMGAWTYAKEIPLVNKYIVLNS